MNKDINQVTKSKIIIFDMGGVILFFDHKLICKRLSKISDYSAQEIYRIIFLDGLEKQYDEGKLTSSEFFAKVKKILDLKINFQQFNMIWSDIFWENKEMVRLITKLKNNGLMLYLLSNTNEMHFKHVKRKFPIIKKFDKYLLSYKIGCRKPDSAIFRKAIQKSALNVDNLIYVDDKEEFVRVAKSMGIKAIEYTPKTNLGKKLWKEAALF